MALPAFREHPFARTLTDVQADRLFSCAQEVRFKEDAFIFREGSHAGTLYLLRAGCVALEQYIPGRGTMIVESLCAGDILGLSWLFPSARWTLDARCVEPVEAFALGADCVRERMKDDPTLGLIS